MILRRIGTSGSRGKAIKRTLWARRLKIKVTYEAKDGFGGLATVSFSVPFGQVAFLVAFALASPAGGTALGHVPRGASSCTSMWQYLQWTVVDW